MKTSELIGPALDWAVAKCEGEVYSANPMFNCIGMEFPATLYSTDWSQGGPIIEREQIDTWCYEANLNIWNAHIQGSKQRVARGKSPLVAAMRCYVASRLGDEVEIPEELK